MGTRYTVPRKPRAGDTMRVGWADSMVQSVRSLVPLQVPGMLISRTTYGTRYTPMASEATAAMPSYSLLPFDVRWLDYGEDDSGNPKGGEWQIYIPLGCLTVSQAGQTYFYIPTNDRAKDADGHNISDWYKIPEPEDTAYANVVQEDDRVATSYTVYLNMKPWPRVKVSTNPTDFKPVYWQVAVAEIRVVKYNKSDRKDEKYAVRLISETQVAKEWDASSPFAIRYDIAEDDFKKKNATPKAMLVNQTRFIGRLQETVAPETDVSSWDNVWVRILHDGETFEMSVEHDLEGDEARSDDDKTVYRIYNLDEMVVTEDLRSSVPEMDFYTSPATATASASGVSQS